MSTTKTENMNWPALDGLRAVSILLVLFSHANLQHIVPGGLGVIVFFVISGFLITSLMLQEIAATGTLSIRLFYIRRILRLFPTLLLALLISVPALILLGGEVTATQVASVLFYVANYFHIYSEYPNFSPFPIFWSLAVEEHFYIFFPFIIYVLRHNLRALTAVVITGMAVILAWRFHVNAVCLHGDAPYALCGVADQLSYRVYHGTDTIVDCILYGVLAALFIRRAPDSWKKPVLSNAAFYGSGLVLLATLLYREPTFRETVRYSLQSLAVAVLILNLLFGQQAFWRRWLETRPAVLIGRWSYALYIFHFVVLSMIGLIANEPGDLQTPLDFVIYFTASFALAAATYAFLEKPMQKIRKHFRAKGATA